MQNRLSSLLPSGAHPLNRRNFLVGAGSAGLLFGFSALGEAPSARPEMPAGRPALNQSQFEPTMWFAIDDAGNVTINIIRAEMGQHVGTALARILADELEADWSKVGIVHVDTAPQWGEMVTGGSWSVFQTFPVFSRAGAAGRIALIEAGARLLGVSPGQCHARNHEVIGPRGHIAYGDIVRMGKPHRTFTPDALARLPIKPVAERRLIGRETAALDIPGKTNGRALYGIDAKVPGMVYARPKLPPTRYGSKVLSVDDKLARTIKGYRRFVVLDDPSATVDGWVLAIADTYPAAIKAAEHLAVEWKSGGAVKVSEEDLQRRASDLIADSTSGSLLDTGPDSFDTVFASAPLKVEATYTTGSVLHFQLEPLNALAFEKDGKMEVHTGNQWQTLILPTLSKALNRPVDQIVMRSYLLGGGFGRRLNGDYAVPAALAAAELKQPVKLILTRADDARFDSIRSPSVQRVRAGLSEDGRLLAMDHAASAGWPTQILAPFFMPKGRNGVPFDPFSINGADHWYEVGTQRVRAIPNDLANESFRPGWLRSVGPGWTNWAVESFIDEAAHAAKRDPVAFRIEHLSGKGRNAGTAPNSKGGARRQAAVVTRAARLSGWGEQLPQDSGRGIATSFGQEREMPTWTACVAQVRVERTSGTVTVEKLTIVVDAGSIIDPGGAEAQIEGGALWGMSMALLEGTQFHEGQVRDTNLDTYTPLRMLDMPEVVVDFMPSDEPPTGLGEPGTTVVGPAIANAIFAATGARMRHIPMRKDAILTALQAR